MIKRVKKVLNIAKYVCLGLLVTFAISMMVFTIVSVNTFNRNDRSILGYRIYIVMSDSMRKTDFSAGDLIFVKKVEPASLEEGDIIAYISQNSDNFGETVTHKIREKTVNAEGEQGFITYGTTTNTNDKTIVTYPYVLGKYSMHIPGLGSFFLFLKSTSGYVLCILIPFLLLILHQGIRCINLFRKYRKEQLEVLRQEREAIERERAENARVLAQLQVLQAGNISAVLTSDDTKMET